jgi:5-methylcytosine-specific restriction protein A
LKTVESRHTPYDPNILMPDGDFSYSGLEIEGSFAMQSESKKQSNPPWSRDELILALDLYLRHRSALPGKHHPIIEDLSQILNSLGTATGAGKNGSFRNPNGVYMKLNNFRRWDPAFTSLGLKGLTKGNKDEGIVWAEFSDDAQHLAKVVMAIKATVLAVRVGSIELAAEEEPGCYEAEEGRVLTRVHRIRERDKKLVRDKKTDALKRYGRLQCEACGFDFAQTYGADASEIIEVHHTRPLHTLLPGDKTKISELALLCANCHRVVHSKRKWMTVEQVRLRFENKSDAGHPSLPFITPT